ncbi:MAG: diguanylate cyclase, partial [Thiotrichales bacterium]|nr:diguanylate cyclase [Thiotrichales bacterium]
MSKENLHNQAKPIRVLLIEDNPGDARLLQEMLKTVPGVTYMITHVISIRDAIEQIQQARFDIVLTDLSLPDAEGSETVEMILEADNSLPVVVLSGTEDENFALEVVKLGAQDYLVKGQGDGYLYARAIRYAIERKKVEQGLSYMAQYDSLTSLANRSLFIERLDRAVVRAQRNSSQVAIMFIDLDRFKHINDTLGHNAGDQLLKEVANRLAKCTREEDTVSRFGGDEFTVILENTNHVNDVVIVANKIIKSIANPICINDQELFITPSIGISMYPSDADTVERLIKHADTAMYRAKEEGRNGFQFYTEGMNRETEQRMELESRLRQALHHNEFELHYQPKVDIQNGNIVGAEALLRWNQRELGMIPPDRFIPLAEDIGLINAIGEWVNRETFIQMQEWISAGLKPIRVAINLSPRQFSQKDLADNILDTSMEYSIVPRNIELEITESLLMNDTDASINILSRLKDWGMNVSIDDFGTGY